VCETNKPVDAFPSGGNRCKACKADAQRKYRQQNPTPMRKYRERNKEKLRAYDKRWYAANSPHKYEKTREWFARNPDKLADYHRRHDSKLSRRLRHNLQRRIHKLLAEQSRSANTMALVGCTVAELRAHLESLFDKNMTWDNYGADGWHIDHIIPCAMFDLQHSEEQGVCFHWTNLQPMWATENGQKKHHWIG